MPRPVRRDLWQRELSGRVGVPECHAPPNHARSESAILSKAREAPVKAWGFALVGGHFATRNRDPQAKYRDPEAADEVPGIAERNPVTADHDPQAADRDPWAEDRNPKATYLDTEVSYPDPMVPDHDPNAPDRNPKATYRVTEGR